MRTVLCRVWGAIVVSFVSSISLVPKVPHVDKRVDKADILVFSYDRPLQLYSYLESLQQYCRGISSVSVIYRASSAMYARAYSLVAKDFSHVIFKEQLVTENTNNFRELTLETLRALDSDYIIFAVDDIIVKDFTDLHECIYYLEQTGAYGFYLRLGTHLYECYPHCKLGLSSCRQSVPAYKHTTDTIISWDFTTGSGDWNYPNTLDMTVYKKSVIYPVLAQLAFHSPNTLEEHWAQRFTSNTQGLCYVTSKILNIPLNKVQEYLDNPHMNLYTTQELLQFFLQGLKIDRAPLHKFNNKAAHTEYAPRFITREHSHTLSNTLVREKALCL